MNRLFDCFPQELKERVVEHRIAQIRSSKKEIDYAFPRARKLPLETQRNVLSAITHLFHVKGVSPAEVEVGYKKIVDKASTMGLCTIELFKQYEQYKTNNALESQKVK